MFQNILGESPLRFILTYTVWDYGHLYGKVNLANRIAWYPLPPHQREPHSRSLLILEWQPPTPTPADYTDRKVLASHVQNSESISHIGTMVCESNTSGILLIA